MDKKEVKKTTKDNFKVWVWILLALQILVLLSITGINNRLDTIESDYATVEDVEDSLDEINEVLNTDIDLGTQPGGFHFLNRDN